MYRAMVVDDEKWTVMGICRTFPWAKYGFAPPDALMDPEEALARILAQPPDAVFVDIRMPAMTGIELMAAARSRHVSSEFIILSGLQDFEYARAAIQYAAFDYLLKPLHAQAADDLMRRLKARLDGQTAAPAPEEPEGDAFSRLVRYIEENLGQPLQLREVAARFYLTPNYVSALFRARLGTTYTAHLNRLRVERARALLRGTRLTVEEIALRCGYSDAQYFSRVFRQASGVSPLRYRREEG